MNTEPTPVPSALPHLSERHAAMLAEMGVPLWWQSAPAPATPAKPSPPARQTALAQPPAVPQAAPTPQTPPPAASIQSLPAPQAARTLPMAAQASMGTDLSMLDSIALDSAIRSCQRCDLGLRRQQAVPGMGDPAPDWLIVGEAPGEEEDRQGLPFVGKAGQLLDKMLAAMGLNRAHKVYIANVIKCRPPHNRNPAPAEISECSPYLLRQVGLLQPKIILAMGRFAANTLLAEGGCLDAATLEATPLGKLRGRVFQAQLGGRTIPVVVTYHPSYLLRSPGEKGKAWADLCLALDAFEAL